MWYFAWILGLPLAALIALAACSGYEEDTPVDPVSETEAEALDDAASMLDERRLPDDAIAPEEQETDPSAPEAVPQ